MLVSNWLGSSLKKNTKKPKNQKQNQKTTNKQKTKKTPNFHSSRGGEKTPTKKPQKPNQKLILCAIFF